MLEKDYPFPARESIRGRRLWYPETMRNHVSVTLAAFVLLLGTGRSAAQ